MSRANREEPGRKCLGALGSHLPRILQDHLVLQVDVFELEGHDRAVTRAREDGEGEKRTVAAFDLRRLWHRVERLPDLRHGRARLWPMRRRDPGQIVRRIEIFGVAITNAGAIFRLVREPDEKRLYGAEGRMDGRRRQGLAGSDVPLFGEIGLEPLRLFDMELPEVAETVVDVKALDRLGGRVDARLRPCPSPREGTGDSAASRARFEGVFSGSFSVLHQSTILGGGEAID